MTLVTVNLSDLSSSVRVVDMSEIEEFRLSVDQARWLNNSIKNTIKELEDLLEEFISGQGWLALGYDTAWSWWKEEIGEKRLGGSARDKVILQFKEEGVSNKKIGPAVGVTPMHVGRLVTGPEVTNVTPIEPTEILDPTTPGLESQDPFHDPDLPSSEELDKKIREMIQKDDEKREKIVVDIPDDRGVIMCLNHAFSSMEIAYGFNRGKMTPSGIAKARIEIQILRDMLDKIEERL